jgi:hypothetical protein
MNFVWSRVFALQAILFVFRQIGKFGPSTDFAKVKIDWNPRIRKLVPGEAFDQQAIKVADAVIDAVAVVAQHPAEFQTLITAIEASDYSKAKDVLLGLIAQKVSLPHDVWSILSEL